MQFCADHGGYLAEITSQTEQNLITSILATKNNYWIGLADFAREGVFIWQHTFSITSYTHWHSGEPSNYGGEDCVHIRADQGHTWNDIDCADPVAGGIANGIHAFCEA